MLITCIEQKGKFLLKIRKPIDNKILFCFPTESRTAKQLKIKEKNCCLFEFTFCWFSGRNGSLSQNNFSISCLLKLIFREYLVHLTLYLNECDCWHTKQQCVIWAALVCRFRYIISSYSNFDFFFQWLKEVPFFL